MRTHAACSRVARVLHAQGAGSRVEFAVYGLLYAALLPRHLASELRGLPDAALAEPAVQHALQVRDKQGRTAAPASWCRQALWTVQSLPMCEVPWSHGIHCAASPCFGFTLFWLVPGV